MSEARRLLRAWASQETGRRAPRNWPVYVTPRKWVRQGGFPVRDTCKECATANGQRSARHEQLHDAQATDDRRVNKNPIILTTGVLATLLKKGIKTNSH